MRLYKYKDDFDGNYAFIVAKDKAQADSVINNITSIPVSFIGSKSFEELNKPIVLINNIIPF